MTIQGQLVDIRQNRIFPAEVNIVDGKIQSIAPIDKAEEVYILPGFVDAHVHIESSMLVPSEFARLAVVHGTVATVSDPHEIANVLGIPGVEYMIANGNQVPFKFNFGAPACVPATSFESAGAVIDAKDVAQLLARPDIRYLSEMMNYPGVLFGDAEVAAKIAAAKALGKPIDGHAPGLRGADAKKYIDAGISTDHECFTYEEGLEKLQLGMKVLIREGSAAKNFAALIPLLAQYPGQIMFCSDDKHPDDLILGHINQLAARALREGCSLFDVLRVACLNPVEHYQLPVGTLQIGDPADFILCENLEDFKVKATYINGQLVAQNSQSKIERVAVDIVNQFQTSIKKAEDFRIPAEGSQIRVIQAIDGEIITKSKVVETPIRDGQVVADTTRDVLKLAVVNRYADAPPALAMIEGFGLQQGALASCVGHDSHNIIAVGCDDQSLCRAINLIIEQKGGISAVGPDQEKVLPLPVAGIMSADDGYQVARQYATIDQMAKQVLASSLQAPFMTLSFMGLLVIPSLKLSDHGLFDGEAFQFTSLFPQEA